MHRSIEEGVLHPNPPGGSVRDMEFLWSTPHSEDDEWLRADLSPLANDAAAPASAFEEINGAY